MYDTFYATLAQVLPVLLLALMWDSAYLARLRSQRRQLRKVQPGGVWFWTKPRVRVYTLTVAIVIVASTAAALLVLGGVVPDTSVLRIVLSAGVVLALGTLLFRIGVDIVVATRMDPDAVDADQPETTDPQETIREA